MTQIGSQSSQICFKSSSSSDTALKNFLKKMADLLNYEVYLPDDVIYKPCRRITKVIFIDNGLVSEYLGYEDDEMMDKQMFTYNRGCCLFGYLLSVKGYWGLSLAKKTKGS